MTWVWAATDGKGLVLSKTENKVNPITDAISQESVTWKDGGEAGNRSAWYGLMIDSRGSSLSAIDRDGKITYWNAESDGKLSVSKTHLSLAGSESQLTCSVPLLGRTSLMMAPNQGISKRSPCPPSIKARSSCRYIGLKADSAESNRLRHPPRRESSCCVRRR